MHYCQIGLSSCGEIALETEGEFLRITERDWENVTRLNVMMIDTLKNSVIGTQRQFQRLLHRDIVSLSPEKPAGKNVLLSYIIAPFRLAADHPAFYIHSNLWECRQIAQSWLDHGYHVDVIDYDNTWFLPKKDYSVFIDIHSNMERIAPLLGKDCIKILHITGAHWQFQNAAEQKRLADIERRRGVRLLPRRQVLPSRGIEFADCATILGNSFTQGTFAFAHKPLYPIPLSTTTQYPAPEKNYEAIRKNFLWMGSTGMVHKGLDLVLEAFSGLPDCRLTVCGPVNKEPDFEKAYRKELYRTENIRTRGFMDTRSDQFAGIVNNSCALIYPSCSEGQAGSVITTLHAGLIPVVSLESGVDTDDFGILLEECSVEEIIRAVQTISGKNGGDLMEMSQKAWEFARANHTRQRFGSGYEAFVKSVLKNGGLRP